MLPSKLKNFNLYSGTQSYLGVAKSITLPKLAFAGEEYRGAGMLAPIDTDMGLEKLEMESTYGGLVLGLLRQFGITNVAGAVLRFVGAYQSDDGSAAVAAELVVRGRHKEIDPGDAEAGKDTEWKVSSTLAYLRWTVNGVTEVEIDILNNVYLVGGVDRMAEIRAILES